MNADREIVPIVEDDQGEGWMNPLDQFDDELIEAEAKAKKKKKLRRYKIK